jgi:hypothetical protein
MHAHGTARANLICWLLPTRSWASGLSCADVPAAKQLQVPGQRMPRSTHRSTRRVALLLLQPLLLQLGALGVDGLGGVVGGPRMLPARLGVLDRGGSQLRGGRSPFEGDQ